MSSSQLANDLAYFTETTKGIKKRASYKFPPTWRHIYPTYLRLCPHSLLFSCDPSLGVIICVPKVCMFTAPGLKYYSCLGKNSTMLICHQFLLLIASFSLAYKHVVFFPYKKQTQAKKPVIMGSNIIHNSETSRFYRT